MRRKERREGFKSRFFKMVSLVLLVAMICGRFPQGQVLGAGNSSGDFEIVKGVLVKSLAMEKR